MRQRRRDVQSFIDTMRDEIKRISRELEDEPALRQEHNDLRQQLIDVSGDAFYVLHSLRRCRVVSCRACCAAHCARLP